VAALFAVIALLVRVADASASGSPTSDGIPTAWQLAARTEGLLHAPPPPNPVTICIIDTGVTPTPDLNITARYAYDGGTLDDVRAGPDSPGHGTVVAHFAAAAVNGWGGSGVFPHARIASVRVFPPGGGPARWTEYISAITRCRTMDARTRVIVIALGARGIADREAEELHNRIKDARDRFGINVVVAAGNSGGQTDFPGSFGPSLTVAAAADRRQLCESSARGVGIDIAAPGCALAQGGWDGSAWSLDGTSFAAPIVAGMLAALRAYSPGLTAEAAERVIMTPPQALAYPLIDGHAAFQRIGLGALLSSAMTLGARLPHPGDGSQPPLRARARRRPEGGLPRPRARLRRLTTGWVFVHVSNRPRDARVRHRIDARRSVDTARSRFRVRSQSPRSFLRLAFVSPFARSSTVRLRMPR
jgi:hypothetical protein